jgi:hypothetical protein
MDANISAANKLLEESLGRFDQRFRVLAPKFFSELRPLGDVIANIELQPEPFVDCLLKFSDAVVTIRTKQAAVRELPVPPYDLWLPFKAEHVSKWDPQALEDASQIFQEKIRGIASLWRMLLETQQPPRSYDPELMVLRDEIMNSMEACNRRCSALAESPLFDPSQTVCNELFVKLIPTYVASEADFDRLVSYLYMAFDEKLRKDVRQPKPERPLLGSLTRVVAVLHGGPFGHLGTLRNKFASCHDHKEDASKVAPIYRQLVQKDAIDRDDIATWQRLQKALLEMLRDVLKQVRECFGDSPAGAYDSASAGRR